MGNTHRNLSTRTHIFELLLQTFWAKKNPCKKSADLHPRQGNLLHWNIFTGLNETSLLQVIGWRPAEKKSPVFFNMRYGDTASRRRLSPAGFWTEEGKKAPEHRGKYRNELCF
jgi:hypothetical protein